MQVCSVWQRLSAYCVYVCASCGMPPGFGAAAYMRPLLQNLCLSLGDNEELCYCLKAWMELPQSIKSGGRPSKEEALQAVAVINRIRRALAQV